MKKRLFQYCLAPVLVWISTAVQATPLVYLDFDGDGLQDSNILVHTGETLTASIYISGIDASHGGLISWGSELDFNPGLLTANSYSIAPAWPLHGINNQIDNGAGVVELLASSFAPALGTLALFDISFSADNSGFTLLSLQQLFSSNSSFTGFSGADGYDYDADILFGSADVTISTVPVPAAILLFISGLLTMLGHKRFTRVRSIS